VKAVCPSCERLIDVTAVKVVGDTAFIGCSKCGVESALPVTTGALPPLADTPKAAPPTPVLSRKTPGPRALVLASSAEASNVVMLRAPTAAAVESARAMAEDDAALQVPDGYCPKCLSRRPVSALACSTCGLSFANVDLAALAPPAWLASMWKELLLAWDDEGRHASLRRLALEREDLPSLARLYRLRLAHMPDDPWAQRGRDEVFAAASSVMLARPPDAAPSGGSFVTKAIVVVASLLAIFAAGAFMLKALSQLR
jgi:transcription elongation factor Elf1